MGKKGPCLHCGINSTPLWRNGPADKPVLCNACGSRFKLKGYLDDDYLPKNVHYLKNNVKTGTNGGTEADNDDHEEPPNSGNNGNSTSMSNPDEDHISSKDFGKKNPSRKRSRVEYHQMTPMEEFHKQLLDLYKSEMGGIEPSTPKGDLVEEKMNNFIPSNEIGLGVTLLKTDHIDDVTSTDPGSLALASSSIDNPSQCDQSSTTAPPDQ